MPNSVRARVAVAVMLALTGIAFVMAAGCGGGGVEPSGPYGTVSLKISWPQGVAGAREIPPRTESIAITVTGQGVSPPITRTITKAEVVNNWAQVSLRVPPGAGRTVLVEALDAGGARCAAGQATVDVTAGTTANVVIRLQQAPIVDAGPDQTVTLAAGAKLSGTVADDGLPDPPGAVTATWSQTSGPGTVNFADPNSASTTASFSALGTYVLRLTADDGSLQAWDETTIQVIEGGPREWTWMMYIASANNLEYDGYADINEMEAVTYPIGGEVQVIALQDVPEWSGTAQRYVVTQDSDPNTITSPATDLGYINSGDWRTLRDFINWCVANYPANRYGLVIWNHGGGFRDRRPSHRNVCWDDDTGDSITVPEVAQALADVGSVDILAFDACLMQMIETAYELRDRCGYCVGSEETIPTWGFDYTDMLTRILGHYTAASGLIAADIVDSYAAFYAGSGDTTLSAIDSSKVGAVAGALDRFAQRATSIWDDALRGQTYDLGQSAQAFAYADHKDLRHLTELAPTHLDDAQLRAEMAALQEAVDAAVTRNYSEYENAHGVCVWWPSEADRLDLEHYRELAMAVDTQWDELLAQFGPPPPILTIRTSWSGGSPGTDFDAYLVDAQDPYNVCYYLSGAIPGAQLLSDAWGPAGEETIEISRLYDGPAHRYDYLVNRYNGTATTMTTRVLDADGVEIFTLSGEAYASGGYYYWHVLTIDPVSGRITAVNTQADDWLVRGAGLTRLPK